MTFTPKEDLASGVLFVVQYQDGGEDMIAVPRSTLYQGPREGWDSIARIIAREWMEDGYIRPGEIARVRLPYRSEAGKVAQN